MNILFYHGDETCPTMGGIQRVTSIIAEGLTSRYGYRCYNIYNYPEPYPDDVPRYKYVKAYHLPVKFASNDVAKIIIDNEIDAIINQMGVKENSCFRDAITESRRDCKLLYFHHTTPRRLWDLSFAGTWRSLKTAKTLRSVTFRLAKVCLFPLYRYLFKEYTLASNARNYREIYDKADKFVLLSKHFYDEWQDLTGINDLSKLRAIPNCQSFEISIGQDTILKKKNKLLLVARMVEFPKRVILALDIWKKITEDQELSDWTFDIVGTGPDLELFEKYAQHKDIPRVRFYGRQESLEYFMESSIFIMTSIREGWGMTLVEALQTGTVPMAFDSFGSVREIIIDGECGFLIRPFDKEEYVSKLKILMKDTELRNKMAIKAIQHSELYTKEKVLDMWHTLLNEKH